LKNTPLGGDFDPYYHVFEGMQRPTRARAPLTPRDLPMEQYPCEKSRKKRVAKRERARSHAKRARPKLEESKP